MIRGIHFADVPPGQAKYVTCVSGAILDVVVDLRAGSPGFGRWEAVRLDDDSRRAVFLAEGLGHGFTALSDEATVLYLCSTAYAPGREHGVNPLDPAIGIAWPADAEPVLSDKDAAAPTLEQALRDGLLPPYADCAAPTCAPARPAGPARLPTRAVTRRHSPPRPAVLAAAVREARSRPPASRRWVGPGAGQPP